MDKRIYAVLFICSTLVLSSCTQEPAAIVRHSASSPAKPGFVSSNPYKATVEKGDTLYSIARKNNVEVRAMIDANHMRPPYTLIPGQTIKLPKAAFHIASDSDTLYAISRSYNVDIGRLAKKNGLNEPYVLAKGQKLYLPSQAEGDNDSPVASSKIQYDFGTKESYGASRGVASSELAPIGSAPEKTSPQMLAGNDNDSPFSSSVSEEKLAPPSAAKEATTTTAKDTENLDKKVAEPFTYKSESAFGDSDSESATANTKPAHKTPEVVVGKTDTNSVNKSAPTPIISSPMPALSAAKTATPDTSVASESEEPFAEQKSVKSSAKASKEGFIWPASGKVISGFGPKKGGLYNDGINISAKQGAPIKAASDGEVVYAGNELRGYGNMLLIKHNNGYLTAYAHASDISVKKGDAVKAGQTIGHIGQTGHVSSPQLHFSIRQGRKAIDPVKYLP